MLRRLRLVALVALVGGAVWWWWQQRQHAEASVAPVAAGPGPAGEPAPAPAPFVAVAVPAIRWVAPVDGECPDGFPVKANANSGIFHVPGGRFYDRTVPERCYATADDAEADGYRRAKA